MDDRKNNAPVKAAEPAVPEKRPEAKAQKADKRVQKVGAKRIDKASSANLVWDKLSAILPAVMCWLLVVAGLALVVLPALCMLPVGAAFAAGVSLAPKILYMVAGVAMIVAGVFLMRRSFKGWTMALVVVALALSAVALGFVAELSAEAAGKGAFLAAGVVAVVLTLIAVLAVDLAFNMGLTRYFREMFGELKKLTWLSGKELFSHTLAVVVFVLGMALLIYALDTIFGTGFSLISKIKIG